MPAIHIDGDYLIDGPDAGQGILLVEGDLVLRGSFEWYGAILVKGGLRFDGGAYVYGAVRTGYTDMGAGNAEIHYSDCAIQRALSRPELMQVHPLGQRPWFQRR